MACRGNYSLEMAVVVAGSVDSNPVAGGCLSCWGSTYVWITKSQVFKSN